MIALRLTAATHTLGADQIVDVVELDQYDQVLRVVPGGRGVPLRGLDAARIGAQPALGPVADPRQSLAVRTDALEPGVRKLAWRVTDEATGTATLTPLTVYVNSAPRNRAAGQPIASVGGRRTFAM